MRFPIWVTVAVIATVNKMISLKSFFVISVSLLFVKMDEAVFVPSQFWLLWVRFYLRTAFAKLMDYSVFLFIWNPVVFAKKTSTFVAGRPFRFSHDFLFQNLNEKYFSPASSLSRVRVKQNPDIVARSSLSFVTIKASTN